MFVASVQVVVSTPLNELSFFRCIHSGVDTQRVQYKKLQRKLSEQGKHVEDSEDTMEGVTQRLELTEGQASDPSATAAVEPNGSLGVAPKPLVGRLTVDRI